MRSRALGSTIAGLMAPPSGRLAELRFFKPKPRFFAEMRSFLNLQLYDVGAGVGHVASLLRADDHRVIAIDIAERDGQYGVVLANGASYPYEPDSVVLLARPCHGVFPSLVVEHAKDRGVAWAVYVRHPRNRKADVGMFWLVARDVGEDGESMYVRRLQ